MQTVPSIISAVFTVAAQFGDIEVNWLASWNGNLSDFFNVNDMSKLLLLYSALEIRSLFNYKQSALELRSFMQRETTNESAFEIRS